MIDRVNFERDRVKPWFSLDASVGADIWKKDNRGDADAVRRSNMNNGLNLINFAGLFSGNSIAPPRSYAVRLQTSF